MGTVADLTVTELRDLIAQVVEEKLNELLRDPDDGLELRSELVADLEARMERVLHGNRGIPADEVLGRLGL
jgi:hypothetical protein